MLQEVEEKVVYLVIWNYYSYLGQDQQVSGVFRTKFEAKQYAAHRNKDNNSTLLEDDYGPYSGEVFVVEEWPVS